jgi:hypothetical protein
MKLQKLQADSSIRHRQQTSTSPLHSPPHQRFNDASHHHDRPHARRPPQHPRHRNPLKPRARPSQIPNHHPPATTIQNPRLITPTIFILAQLNHLSKKLLTPPPPPPLNLSPTPQRLHPHLTFQPIPLLPVVHLPHQHEWRKLSRLELLLRPPRHQAPLQPRLLNNHVPHHNGPRHLGPLDPRPRQFRHPNLRARPLRRPRAHDRGLRRDRLAGRPVSRRRYLERYE